MAKISVIGSGGWGIALAILLHENGHNLTIWSFDKKEVEELKETRQNTKVMKKSEKQKPITHIKLTNKPEHHHINPRTKNKR